MAISDADHMEINYRKDYREHKIQLMDLIGRTQEELTEFQKWAESEDDAADIAEGIRTHMCLFIENVAKNMRTAFEKRESIAAPDFDSDELGYPSYNESNGDEYGFCMSNGTIINRKNGASDFTGPAIKMEGEEHPVSLWKGKGREVNPQERVIDTYIPPTPYMDKGKEPEIPYGTFTTRSAGEATHSRLVGSETLVASKTVVWERFESLVKEVNVFQGSWGMGKAGTVFLKHLARSMRDQVKSIQTFIGRVPSPDDSLALGSEYDNSANRHLRTSGQLTMPSRNERKTTTPETDQTERESIQYKIIIPARGTIQLPPRDMRKKNKHLADDKFESDVDGQLEGEAKEEEVSLYIESISQGFRPVQRRTRYNLRSNARRNNVAGPSRVRDEPVPTEQKRNKKEVSKPEGSKRTSRKRQVEDEEDNSHRNKKRRREDEVKKREVKKEGLNKKRKRDDDNVNEEKKTRKRTKRN